MDDMTKRWLHVNVGEVGDRQWHDSEVITGKRDERMIDMTMRWLKVNVGETGDRWHDKEVVTGKRDRTSMVWGDYTLGTQLDDWRKAHIMSQGVEVKMDEWKLEDGVNQWMCKPRLNDWIIERWLYGRMEAVRMNK